MLGMRGIKREIIVTVKTEDGRELHVTFETMPRSIGGAFLAAIGMFPDWATITIVVTKERA